MGFPTGDRYTGSADQNEKLENQYLRKAEFMRENNLAQWNGEFGPVYEPESSADATEINKARCEMLGQQLTIYDKYQVPWSTWLYKDIGLQGMVYTNPNSKWNRTIQPFLDKKRKHRLDAWGVYPAKEAEDAIALFVKWIDEVCPTAKDQYPGVWDTHRQVMRAVVQTFMSESFSDEFAGLFKDMDFKELDELAHSFHFSECVQREYLNKVMTEHAPIS